MTVPLDVMNDIRSMDAGGVPRAEIARRLGVSRNTVAKHADMEDMLMWLMWLYLIGVKEPCPSHFLVIHLTHANGAEGSGESAARSLNQPRFR